MAKGKSLAEFQQAHDRIAAARAKVAAGLAALGDSWEYEGEFIKRCGLSTGTFGRLKAEIASHLVLVRRKDHGGTRVAVGGTSAFAAKLRATVTTES